MLFGKHHCCLGYMQAPMPKRLEYAKIDATMLHFNRLGFGFFHIYMIMRVRLGQLYAGSSCAFGFFISSVPQAPKTCNQKQLIVVLHILQQIKQTVLNVVNIIINNRAHAIPVICMTKKSLS